MFDRSAYVCALLAALLISTTGHAEEEAEDPGWTGKVSVGGSLSRGNVDSLKGVV